MRRILVGTLVGLTLPLLALGVSVRAAEPQKTLEPKKDAVSACMEMMQGTGVTDEGRKAMRKFMQSDRAPKTMANMMEMTRKMGNGDTMLGMTKMMEMMGSTGGAMMGGRGGMMR